MVTFHVCFPKTIIQGPHGGGHLRYWSQRPEHKKLLEAKCQSEVVFLSWKQQRKVSSLHMSQSPYWAQPAQHEQESWTKNTGWHGAGCSRIPTSTPRQSSCCGWVLWLWCHWMLLTTEPLYGKWKGLKTKGPHYAKIRACHITSSVIDVSELLNGVRREGTVKMEFHSCVLIWTSLWVRII